MTRIVSDPDTFVAEALDGLVLAHSQELRRVDGGVARRSPLSSGQVAVVVGGGSGHYPAFAGIVGVGMPAAAVCGNIFSSPSAGQAVRVARAVEAGGGVLFSYGNYAGDVIHFGEAERRLRDEGLDVRTVLVTDDIASAPAAEAAQRRGIAGDLCVFRIAGAAAERGDSLDAVERLARHANDRTRTIGVAFSGCTVPGASEPLFEVPEGMMSIGLGIHGEPGIRDVPVQAAPELARTLLEPLLAERPQGAESRVALLVNGLGTVKYEELFVLFGHLHRELEQAGIAVTSPLCGELVTSLDMGGVSVTLLWLDDELEELWDAPAASPAFRRGTVVDASNPDGAERPGPIAVDEVIEHRQASASSQRAAETARELLALARDAVVEQADSLGALDAIAGDGDHGIGMSRGLEAAVAAASSLPAGAGLSALLTAAGEAWSEIAGGTSGALWGAALSTFGRVADDAGAQGGEAVSAAVTAARARIAQLGGAEAGDKTMLDALLPFDVALRSAVAEGAPVATALRQAASAASGAAQETASLRPRKGRARPLAEKSLGHPDPGAVSFALIVETLADWADADEHTEEQR
ncbi:dihydroxyacetone kinase family protein [Microbacterium sp. SSW1-49]|uniref:Dihydroxyacetone kinase family protein n=1 Tax=Microbacterium croceum TaxID=2851645 RepID=A0ABT0F970_9MICO|nr:dihydroxyacetone kinase family protein [Microbacterium croceum]MCK2034599.1 dihydroxyacetone kinase family protein [Microbacterium croceum]